VSDPDPIYRLATPTARGRTWLLKRNCSITPGQLWVAYGVLAGLSLSIAGFFWWWGAVLVLPFAALELLALGVAFLWYCRHATDRECISLEPSRLVVEWEHGGRLSRHEFPRQWVRVAQGQAATGLIDLSAAGQKIQVGRYVRPDLRPQLARELRLALA
jgi:uncharacterized membrane protein